MKKNQSMNSFCVEATSSIYDSSACHWETALRRSAGCWNTEYCVSNFTQHRPSRTFLYLVGGNIVTSFHAGSVAINLCNSTTQKVSE